MASTHLSHLDPCVSFVRRHLVFAAAHWAQAAPQVAVGAARRRSGWGLLGDRDGDAENEAVEAIFPTGRYAKRSLGEEDVSASPGIAGFSVMAHGGPEAAIRRFNKEEAASPGVAGKINDERSGFSRGASSWTSYLPLAISPTRCQLLFNAFAEVPS
ncbi:uncharacterized protein LY79DRAFT_527457 [Colletotrichum navitas]|uniref:Uncharacterized protein n=1 Tax=Colletotrichum navitas TaxID=681940 RepID=A0AAD8UYH6_9PEZI|nr:uncharacterized protein LY79DRAFT_527457 [Colletotrichum navitas]KAK1570136.1 hypothetical protein LY79DRAFT_527457 [Colletotrichum navitas]